MREPLVERANYHLLQIYIGNGLNRIEQLLYCFVRNNCVEDFDVGGLLPSGENDGWGSGGTSRGNCWRYACNDKVAAKDRDNEHKRKISPPGVEVDENDRLVYTCESIAKGLKTRYGIDKVDKDKACPGDNCYYKVLLVLQVQSSNLTTGEETYSDYHWYRQDTDKSGKPTGTWSHKPGDSSVRGGVTDPERDAKRGDGRWFRYERICGYFCFPSCGVDAD